MDNNFYIEPKQWWKGQEWFIVFDGKRILTPAGECAELHCDIVGLTIESIEVKGSKKRQHIIRFRRLKETIKFLKLILKECEEREIGTTAYFALLQCYDIDEI